MPNALVQVALKTIVDNPKTASTAIRHFCDMAASSPEVLPEIVTMLTPASTAKVVDDILAANPNVGASIVVTGRTLADAIDAKPSLVPEILAVIGVGK